MKSYSQKDDPSMRLVIHLQINTIEKRCFIKKSSKHFDNTSVSEDKVQVN